jgi:arsenate reductase
MNYPIRVLFLCTGNSARSQMAEGLLRSLGGADFEVFSAGTDPKGLNPLAVEVMREANIDISRQESKSLERYLGQQFDYIITVCDRARDNCPTFPGDNERIHWGYDDPAAATGSHTEQLAVFRRIRNEIGERLRLWAAVQRKRISERSRAG